MKTKVFKISFLVLVGYVLSGCGALIDLAITGAGKSATAEDTGFFKSYDGLVSTRDPAYSSLPDLYSVSTLARIKTYNKVLMPDFSSLNPNIDKLKGLQIRQYKTIKQDLPDAIANTFDGSGFSSVRRMSDRVDPKDIDAIKKLPADAILMGNIKELASVGGENEAGLTAIQVEYKLIDVKTGEEVLRAIHRSTTDLDKVAMAQVRVLTGLVNKAKAAPSSAQGEQSIAPQPAVTQPSVTEPPAPVTPRALTKDMISEAQVKLKAQGFDPGVPDGSLGAKTREAVRRFQTARHLQVTGGLDTATLEALGI